MEKLKKFILPTAFIAVGLFLSSGVAYAMPLPGESIVGDYTLKISAMGKVYEYSYPEIDCAGGELYLKNVEEIVDGIYFDTKKDAVPASVKIYPERGNPFVYRKEKNGVAIDREKLIEDIKVALYARKTAISAKTKTLFPDKTEKDLRKNTAELASFSTDYFASTEERKFNIALAVKGIGGIELRPGEEFSFNAVVGERSAERGYKEAKIIEGGKFVEGRGGGVCQVSSTLYNSALLSGLEITERHSHSLLVSYVEPSFDAMVSSGSADLKFKNDRDESVFIVGSCDGEKILFRIYGKDDGYRYKRAYEIIGNIPAPDDEIVKNEALFPGERRVLTASKAGTKSAGYLEKYYGGKLVERKKLGEDTYLPVRGVVEIGVKKETFGEIS